MREFRAMPRTSKLLGSMRMGHLPKHAGIHAGARMGKGVFAAWLPEACRRRKAVSLLRNSTKLAELSDANCGGHAQLVAKGV